MHAARTQDRTRWGYLAGWEGPRGLGFGAQFENEHAVANSSNYGFWTNQLTLWGAASVRGVSGRVEVMSGVRNYFPASIFDSNFRRRDANRALRVELRRAFAIGEVVLRDEVLDRDSSRPDRSFLANTFSLSLGLRYGR